MPRTATPAAAAASRIAPRRCGKFTGAESVYAAPLAGSVLARVGVAFVRVAAFARIGATLIRVAVAFARVGVALVAIFRQTQPVAAQNPEILRAIQADRRVFDLQQLRVA